MKPPRTVGLSLAIIASVLLFSVLPLLQLTAPYLIQYRLSQVTLLEGSEDSAPLAVGSSFTGIGDGEVVVQAIISLAYLVIAVGAWRGRPPWIRSVMIAAVLLLLLVTTLTGFAAINAPVSFSNGVDSSRELTRSLVVGRIAISALVALYVLWYMNRGPARAFYRGYYAQRDEQAHALRSD